MKQSLSPFLVGQTPKPSFHFRFQFNRTPSHSIDAIGVGLVLSVMAARAPYTERVIFRAGTVSVARTPLR